MTDRQPTAYSLGLEFLPRKSQQPTRPLNGSDVAYWPERTPWVRCDVSCYAASPLPIVRAWRDRSYFRVSFDFAFSRANRSALSRSRFLPRAFCSSSYSVSGLSDGRNTFASFSRLLMT